MIYYKFFQNDYFIPMELEQRFLELGNKVEKLGEDPDFIEAYRGYKIVFLDEFKKYRIKFRIGDIWEKQTEEWYGNAPRGSQIRIISIDGSFIRYRHIKRWLGIDWNVGYRYYLNKWSFLRIFGGEYEGWKTDV
nr:MAG: hypothetical protein [Caudoviricetes sp.]